jgi:transketolase
MRKEFSQWMEKKISENPRIVFLTGDLGYMAFEGVAKAAGSRFVNVGVSEQNMISLAAGLASQGLLPFCYSIAPFAVFRPLEQIRLDVCIHKMNVKIIGNGGGYGYGIMGATHHALEDLACLSSMPHMKCFVPLCNEDLFTAAEAMMSYDGPSYLRMGAGTWPSSVQYPGPGAFRKVLSGDAVVIVGLGPSIQNVLKAEMDRRTKGECKSASIYAISELPLLQLNSDFAEEVKRTGRLVIVEEHVQRGGLAEHLSLLLMQNGISAQVRNLCARGYPNGLYGSQTYHQRVSNLDSVSITQTLSDLLA